MIDALSYQNGTTTLNIRHTVYDSLGNLYSRPRFDVMSDLNTVYSNDMYGYPDGIYTSEVHGWRSDDHRTNHSVISFVNYICMDIDNSGDEAPDINDLTYMTNYMFQGGPEPPHMASADLNCSGGVPNISDIIMLVTYMFQEGPPGTCCHSLVKYDAPARPRPVGVGVGKDRY